MLPATVKVAPLETLPVAVKLRGEGVAPGTGDEAGAVIDPLAPPVSITNPVVLGAICHSTPVPESSAVAVVLTEPPIAPVIFPLTVAVIEPQFGMGDEPEPGQPHKDRPTNIKPKRFIPLSPSRRSGSILRLAQLITCS